MPRLMAVEIHPEPPRVPVTGRAARVRQALWERRGDLAERDEVGALDTTAAWLARWHEDFDRRVPAVSLDRTPRYRHKQLDGEHSLPAEDVAAVVLSDPERAAAGLSILVEAAGFAPLQPRAGSCRVGSPGQEAAETISAFGRALETWARAVADRELSCREATQLLPMVDQLLSQVLDWRTALQRVAGEEEGT